jgi:putative protein-disulfide isomerase
MSGGDRSGSNGDAVAARLLYVADPMCSWCWGFAPVLERLHDDFELPVEVIVGGLRPGPAAEPLDSGLRTYLRSTWTQIAQVTGQPVDLAPLDWEGWLYDTELPALAVVATRWLAPERELDMFTRLQRAFYAEAVDVTSEEAYPPLVESVGLDLDAFRARMSSDENKQEAWHDFDRARALGVNGFPALFLIAGESGTVLTAGYRPYAAVAPVLRRALGSRGR